MTNVRRIAAFGAAVVISVMATLLVAMLRTGMSPDATVIRRAAVIGTLVAAAGWTVWAAASRQRSLIAKHSMLFGTIALSGMLVRWFMGVGAPPKLSQVVVAAGVACGLGAAVGWSRERTLREVRKDIRR